VSSFPFDVELQVVLTRGTFAAKSPECMHDKIYGYDVEKAIEEYLKLWAGRPA